MYIWCKICEIAVKFDVILVEFVQKLLI